MTFFLGRTEEQERFLAALDQVTAGKAEAGPSPVVLVQGLGGIGKSRLLGRFHDLARERGQDVLPVPLDWENERTQQPDAFPGSGTPDVVTVANALHGAVVSATRDRRRLGRRTEQAFTGFRDVAARQPVFELRMGLWPEPASTGRTAFDDVGAIGAAAAKAVASAVPGGAAVASASEAVPAVLGAARRMRRRDGVVDARVFEAVTRPRDALAHELAGGLRELSRKTSLVLLLDTYEIVAGAGPWLRAAIRQSGGRVLWVLAGRIEDEAGSGPAGEAAMFHRELPEGTLRTIALSRFTDEEVRLFLRHRLGTDVDDDLVQEVAEVTRGVPLSVQLVARMLERGVDVADVLRPVTVEGDSPEVVREMAERYLVHVACDATLRPDLPLLYGLALVHGDRSDPELVRALWGEVADVATALAGLATRHDFVRTETRRLHETVRDTIRAYLLDAARREAVRPVNARAVELLRARAASGPTTVEAQFEDDMWRATMTALAWHTFWVSNDAGLELVAELTPGARLLQPGFSSELLDVASFFLPTLDRRQTSLLRGVAELCRWWSGTALDDATTVDVERATGLLRRHAAGSVVAADRDPRALVDLLLAQRSWEDPERQRACVERAAALLTPTGGEVDAVLAAEARWAAADALAAADKGGPPDGELRMAELATRFAPGEAFSWVGLSSALCRCRRFDAALDAAERAVEIDADNAVAHNQRGVVLSWLGRHDEALAAYERSLSINDTDAVAHANRGHALHRLLRFDDALAAYLRALEIDPASPAAAAGRVVTLHDLDRFDEALALCEQALAKDPNDGQWHHNRAVILHRLGRFEEALEEMDRATALGEATAAVQASRGFTLLRAGRYGEAAAAFDGAIATDPEYPAAYYGRAEVLLCEGRLADARDDLRRGLDLGQPRSRLAALVMLGAILRRDDPDEAAECFRAALATPGVNLTPFRRGECRAIAMAALGDVAGAVPELERVVALRLPGDDGFHQEVLYDLLNDPPLPGLDRIAELARAR